MKKVKGCKNHYTVEEIRSVFFESSSDANKCLGCDNCTFEDGLVMCSKLNAITEQED